MKINFSSLFQIPLEKYNFFFIYGNDPIVFERTLSFLKKKLPWPLQIKSEDTGLAHSGTQASLFECQKMLTLIPNVSDKFLKSIDKLKDDVFIFTSEKARTQSPLVLYFTHSSSSLAISAYSSPLISSEFEFLVEEMNLPVSFKRLLFKAYQNDYMELLSVLEKIKLYGDVPEAHYESFLRSSTMPDTLTPLIHAILLRNKKEAVSSFSKINIGELISFFRLLLISFQTLNEIMPYKKMSSSIPWKSFKSSIFFKDQPLYERALSKWSSDEVQSFLETLLSLEHQVKFSGQGLPYTRHELLRFL
ncbi:MAG: hypothetical protein K2W92_09715 [Alphaproteobacteria bacterium]|nr:hypothetical protein [Alphaproteobacteria bacterium]